MVSYPSDFALSLSWSPIFMLEMWDPGGDLLHIFWSCPRLSHFWEQVRLITCTLTGLDLSLDPAVFLLHLPPLPRKRYKASLAIHLINAAKACIPALWKSPDPPSIAAWLARVKETNRMKELTASLHDRLDKYRNTWFHWFKFVDSQDYIKATIGSPPPPWTIPLDACGPRSDCGCHPPYPPCPFYLRLSPPLTPPPFFLFWYIPCVLFYIKAWEEDTTALDCNNLYNNTVRHCHVYLTCYPVVITCCAIL